MIRKAALLALALWIARWAAQLGAALIARRLPPVPHRDEPGSGESDTPVE